MAANQTIHCSIITPEQRVLDTTARSVILPAHDGQIGILKDRAPLLCELGIGVLHVDRTDSGPQDFYIDGGFAQVLNNEVTVLTEKAAPTEKLSRADAEKALAAAEQMTGIDDASMEAKRKAIDRAKTQLRLAKG
jgi:F-type H+-transporting ATPase subunit epsilon